MRWRRRRRGRRRAIWGSRAGSKGTGAATAAGRAIGRPIQMQGWSCFCELVVKVGMRRREGCGELGRRRWLIGNKRREQRGGVDEAERAKEAEGYSAGVGDRSLRMWACERGEGPPATLRWTLSDFQRVLRFLLGVSRAGSIEGGKSARLGNSKGEAYPRFGFSALLVSSARRRSPVRTV